MELIRGDYKTIKIVRKDLQGNIIKVAPEEMWLTCKKSEHTLDILFQKKLSDGSIIFNETTGEYTINLEEEDTMNIEYGLYYYDIAILADEKKKTLHLGELRITKHYTFNEGEMTNE